MANEFIIRKGFKSQEDSQITGSISLSGSFKDQESSSGTAGQVLSSTVSGSQWVDAADSSAITGAGTTGTITKWTTGGSVIGDSVIVESAGNVGIGVTPSAWRDSVAVNSVIQGADNYAILNRNDGGTKTNYFAQNFYYNASDVGTRMDTGKWSLFYSQNQEDGSHGFYTSTNDTGPSPSMQSKLIIGSTGAATFKATTPSPVVSTPIVSIADSVNGVLGGIGALASGGYPLQIWGGTLEFKTGSSSNIATATTKLTITSTGLTQINSTSTTALELITNQSASSLRLKNTGSVVADWIMQSGGITVGDLAFYNLDTSAYKLTITSGGDATFSGNVTAVQGIFKNSGVPAILAYRDLDVTVVGTAGQGIEFGAKSGATFVSGAAIYGTLDNPATNGSLQFQTLTAGTLSNKLTISSGGDVLINATSRANGYDTNFKTLSIASTVSDKASIIELIGTRGAGGNQNGMIHFLNNSAAITETSRISGLTASGTNGHLGGAIGFDTKEHNGSLRRVAQFTDSGNLLFALSGKGIVFNQSASSGTSTSETLDAYEEGTWTALLTTTGNPFNNQLAQTGNYTRIGNLVTIQAQVLLSGATSGGTGEVIITGLPFTCSSSQAAYGSFNTGRVALSNTLGSSISVPASTNYIRFLFLVSGQNANVLDASALNGQSTPYISATITYEI